MELLYRFNSILNKGLAFAAGTSLVAMMLVTIGEMVFRIFGKPMAGTVEIIGWLAAATTGFALGYTQINQGHVSIDLFVRRLNPMTAALLNMIVYFLSTTLFAAVTWNIFHYAKVLRETGSLSETMNVIVYPWVYLVSLGCFGLTLALFMDFLKTCGQIFKSLGPKEKQRF